MMRLFQWEMSSRVAAWPRSLKKISIVSLALLLLSGFASVASGATQRATLERSGVFPTREGLTLKVSVDQGSVTIVPLDRGASPVVRYLVHVETDMRGNQAQQIIERYSLTARPTPFGIEIVGALPPQPSHGSQFSVHFEIAVPANYNLDVNTEVGDIEAGDIGGTATLITQGGNIRTQRIGRSGLRYSSRGRPLAKLVTEGGHINIGDVLGDVSAFTAGGHITAGYISGDANLHTGGGHIRAEGIGGRAELAATEGGNITVGKASKYVSAKTGGGQIDFGEVHGSVHAQTGGGGIRVMYVAGPMQLESNEGSICLTKVASSVRAATGDGTITAWINPDEHSTETVRLAGPSQLSSGSGDIIVYLPHNLAANIEAIVETGGEKRIEADPAFALQISGSGSGPTKGWLPLNGGGAPLRLKTTSGRIKLQYLDSEKGLRDSLIAEQVRRLEGDGAPSPPPNEKVFPPLESTWTSKVELALMGGVRVDSETFQQHISYKPLPEYPMSAKKGGVRGRVILQVRLTQDGHVQIEKVVEGSEPSLVDATVATVKRWRGVPGVMNGKKVDMVSTVKIDFQ